MCEPGPTENAADDSTIRIGPLTREHAVDICSWRYPAPYDCYDMVGVDPDDLVRTDLGFHAVLAGRRLIGFRSFGPDGQVPGWQYDDSALDTGGGLRPRLTGRGLGREAISAGLDAGRELFSPPAFRVSVASFNTRALHVVESLGFERIGRFHAVRDARSFEVLVRTEG